MGKHALKTATPTDTNGLPKGWHWPHKHPEEWDRLRVKFPRKVSSAVSSYANDLSTLQRVIDGLHKNL